MAHQTYPFFRIFKVDLHSECPFWQDNPQCNRRNCAVCSECSNDEVPFGSDSSDSSSSASASSFVGGDRVDRTLSGGFTPFSDNDDGQWIAAPKNPRDSVYINMALNPEGYTGYEGEETHRIWRAIYEENCFLGTNSGSGNTGNGKSGTGNGNDPAAVAAPASGLMRPARSADFASMCFEQRVFYRVFSGLHASISTHISNNYPIGAVDPMLDLHSPENCGLIGPNVTQYQYRLGNHPDRLENLYFAFIFMLRAVNKASATLRAYNYTTTNGARDTELAALVDETLSTPLLSGCSSAASFDESSMFSTAQGASLKHQLRSAFRNISRIMDCVGCEKCRLHGKLQILGIGTAIKVLFKEPHAPLALERNEVMALITTLAKFSHALHVVHEFEARIADSQRGNLARFMLSPQTLLPVSIALVLGALGVILYGLRCIVQRRNKSGAGATAIITAAALRKTSRGHKSSSSHSSKSRDTTNEVKSKEQ